VVWRDLRGVGDDVEVWECGLHHEDVGAFVCIAENSSSGKTFRSRGKLVALPVTERRCAPSGVPERPVKRTRKLRRVAHQRTAVPKARINKPALDRLDAPVHHVARRDAVHARARIVHRDLRDARDGRFRVDGSVGVEDAAVSVRGVFTEADVGGDVNVGEEGLDLLGCLDDGSVRVVGGGAALVLLAIHRHAKQNHAPQALLHKRAQELLELVHAPAALTGERLNFNARVRVVGDEDRVHEHRLRELTPALPGARERVLVAALEDG